MFLTAARWAHLSCSTYPLLLTSLTTGSWPTLSIGASIFGVMRWPGLSPTSITEPMAAGGHRRPRHITGILAFDRGPTGFGLGPRSYVIYAEDAQEIFEFQRVMYHLFADDMQGHVSAKPQNARLITSNIQECIAAVSNWCASKRLQLNTKKTEVLWFGSAANLRQVTRADRCLTIGPDVVEPVEVVRALGVLFDTHLTMKAHISRVSRTCFYHLRRLSSIRRCLGREVTARLVSAVIISRLDYCNAILATLPASTLAPLQRVLNAA